MTLSVKDAEFDFFLAWLPAQFFKRTIRACTAKLTIRVGSQIWWSQKAVRLAT